MRLINSINYKNCKLFHCFFFILIIFNFQYSRAAQLNDVRFEEILEQPDNLQLNLLYAKQQESIGKYKNVIATLERLNLLYPNNYDIKLYLLTILIRNDSNARALELFDDLSKDPNLNNDIKSYIENLIKEYQTRTLNTQKSDKKKTYLTVDLSLAQTDHSNLAGISDSGTFFISNNISSYASNEIKHDQTNNQGINVTLSHELSNTSSLVARAGISNTTQDKGRTEENDLVSSSLIYNKRFEKNVVSPYLVYSSPNYRTQNDAHTFVAGINHRYDLNQKTNLNLATSFARNNFNNTSTFTTANVKNNNTYSFNLGLDRNLNESNIVNSKVFFSQVDAATNYNSYDGQGVSISYVHVFPFGALRFEQSLEHYDYLAADSFYNSTIIRQDNLIKTSIGLNGQFKQIPILRKLDQNDSIFYYFNYIKSDTDSNLLNYDSVKETFTMGLTKRFNF